MLRTRFVLEHALDQGLRILLVVNKIDRPGVRMVAASKGEVTLPQWKSLKI